MKRFMSMLAITAALIFGAAACGGDDPAPAPVTKAPVTTEAPVVDTYEADFEQGFTDGYDTGLTEGYDGVAYNDLVTDTPGYVDGFAEGYYTGYLDGVDQIGYEYGFWDRCDGLDPQYAEELDEFDVVYNDAYAEGWANVDLYGCNG